MKRGLVLTVFVMQMFRHALSGLSLEWLFILPSLVQERAEGTAPHKMKLCSTFLANRGRIESFCWCRLLPASKSFCAKVAYVDGRTFRSRQFTCVAP